MADGDQVPAFARTGINLASPRLGSAAVRCSDDFFAPMDRMLADAPPVFHPDRYDDHGKWMDGWESRRRRDGGHDWCLVRLGAAGLVRGVDVDTSFFTGNYPPGASVEACLSDGAPTEDGPWTEIVPTLDLGPSAHHYAACERPGPWNWIRLNIFPDGGVARLRVYGDPVPSWDPADTETVHELSALRNGGRVVAYNDAHYGDVWAILTEGRGTFMGDGWETRRRREPGHDWMVVALGAAGTIERIEVDTAHFKGNYPDKCSVQAARADGLDRDGLVAAAESWAQVLAPQKLAADSEHAFTGDAIAGVGPVTHVRLNIHPDGGVSRFRVFGRLAP